MAKITFNTNDAQLNVSVKLSHGENIDEREISNMSHKRMRALLNFKSNNKGNLEFSAPVAVPITERMKMPIARQEFFSIVSQIVSFTQELNAKGFTWGKVVWDKDYIFYNAVTKEVMFLYLPVVDLYNIADVKRIIEEITYSANPMPANDSAFISKFSFFMQGLPNFNVPEILKYVGAESFAANDDFKKAPIPAPMPEEEDDTALLDDAADTDFLGDEFETMPLGEEAQTVLPTLTRDSTGESAKITKSEFRVGKESAKVDFCVMNNNAVSRSHADIITRGTHYFIVDLNSKNKTYVNAQAIPPHTETEIFSGDKIKLANEEFTFTVE